MANWFNDAITRCVTAARDNERHPLGVWSTGEKLLVALVLWDQQHLDENYYSYDEAMTRVAGGMEMTREELLGFLDAVRVAVDDLLATLDTGDEVED